MKGASLTQDLFGTDEQRKMLSRGANLFTVLRDDPRFSYYGRSVGLADTKSGDPDQLAAMTRLQGVGSCANLSPTDLPDWQRAIEAQGLSITRYAVWSGGAEAIAAAGLIQKNIALPTDLTLHRTTPQSPPQTLQNLADVSLACGVLPIAGAVLRGLSRPGTGIVAVDQAGHPVACAAAAAYYHPAYDNTQCWWGMLATDPSRRGQGLALRLGAEALLDITSRFGFTRVFTGIATGNTASETVCARMGLSLEDNSVISVADPAQLTGGRMTK